MIATVLILRDELGEREVSGPMWPNFVLSRRRVTRGNWCGTWGRILVPLEWTGRSGLQYTRGSVRTCSVLLRQNSTQVHGFVNSMERDSWHGKSSSGDQGRGGPWRQAFPRRYSRSESGD